MRSTPALCALAALFVASSASAETKVTVRDLSSLLAHCAAPMATITVTPFKCKATACDAPPGSSGAPGGMAALLAMAQAAQGQQSFPTLGSGLSNAMATALKATGCFRVMAREDLEDLRREAEAAGVTLKTAPADYLVTGAITALSVGAKNQTFGGGLVPLIGAVNKQTRSAALAIDVRLVDVKAGDVTSSQTFDVSSQRSNWGAGGLGWGGSGALFGAATSTQSAELDSVANESVIEAANFVVHQLAGGAATAPAQPIAAK